MASLVVLPNPTLLEVVSIEVDEAMNMITAYAATVSTEARCPLCQQASQKVHCPWIYKVFPSFLFQGCGVFIKNRMLLLHTVCSSRQTWNIILIRGE